MRAQGNPHVLLHCFLKLLPFRAQRGGRLHWGCSAGGPSCLAPLPFFYTSEAWLGRCSWSSGDFCVFHALQIDLRGGLPLETEGIVIVLRPAPVICKKKKPTRSRTHINFYFYVISTSCLSGIVTCSIKAAQFLFSWWQAWHLAGFN
jgi:hypothetical protein